MNMYIDLLLELKQEVQYKSQCSFSNMSRDICFFSLIFDFNTL